MRHSLDVSCIEVCKGDQLAGYAIFFSGGWDAYIVDGRHSLIRIGSNFISAEGALRAIKEGKDWRKS